MGVTWVACPMGSGCAQVTVNNGSEAQQQRSWQFIRATEMPEQPPSSEALCRSPAGVA